MAISDQRVINGVVRIEWDDDLEQYREYSAARVVTTQRAYTALEREMKAERVARAAAIAKYTSTKTTIAAGVAALTADIATLNTGLAATNAQINAAPATYIRPLMEIAKRLDESVIYLAKMASDTL